MRNMILALVAVLVLMAGCSTLPPYFTNPQNTSVFGQLGMNCVLAQPQEYAAGVAYSYVKTPQGYHMAQSHLIKVLIQCGNELYTVNCDPTLPPEKNPCANLVIWHPAVSAPAPAVVAPAAPVVVIPPVAPAAAAPVTPAPPAK